MPSALTARIVDDPTDTFEAFAWRCASQFFHDCGRAPDEVNPDADSYYRTELAESKRRLDAVLAMSDAAASAYAKNERDLWLKSARESREDAVELAARVAAFRAKLDAWNPPIPELESGLKRIMREQLDQLCEYEANVKLFDKRIAEIEEIPTPTGAEWRRDQIAAHEDSVKRCEARLRVEELSNVATNAWLSALRKSIPRPVDEWGAKK